MAWYQQSAEHFASMDTDYRNLRVVDDYCMPVSPKAGIHMT